MPKFFKVTFPDNRSIVVVSNRGWAGLIGLFNNAPNEGNTYITQISLTEFVKYMFSKRG